MRLMPRACLGSTTKAWSTEKLIAATKAGFEPIRIYTVDLSSLAFSPGVDGFARAARRRGVGRDVGAAVRALSGSNQAEGARLGACGQPRRDACRPAPDPGTA